MKKLLLILLLVGFSLGIAQIFYIRDITKQNVEAINTNNPACLAIIPECGACIYEIKDGNCYSPPYKQKFRGFPFTSGSYGKDSKTNISLAVLLNVIILTIGVPLIGLVVLKLKNQLQNK